MKRKRKKRQKKIVLLTSLFLFITSVILGYNMFKVNILGVYLYAALAIIVIVDYILIKILNKKIKFFLKVPFILIALFLTGSFVYASYNLDKTGDFFKQIAASAGLREETFIIYADKKSQVKELSDLNGTVGVYENGSSLTKKAVKKLKSNVDIKTVSYDDLDRILDSGLDRKNSAIMISSSLSELLHENYKEKYSNYKKIGEITVITREKIKKSDVDVTKKPFVIYLSGIDTYGSINEVSRSDVNILAVVNPVTNKVLLINTPRDYYVTLGTKGEKDKLTHAGIYGINESIKTLEKLYDTDIAFYVKVNFTSLIKLVDTVDGIDINSKYSFYYDGCSFRVGENHLNGKEALAFSRYRKGLPGGDISRGENQEEIIRGLIKKITSPSIIKNYSSILKAVSDGIVTNMDDSDIYKLAKYQIRNKPNWDIESIGVTGRGDYKTTYSAGATELYVMMPNEEEVASVKEKINNYLNNSK